MKIFPDSSIIMHPKEGMSYADVVADIRSHEDTLITESCPPANGHGGYIVFF